MEELFKKIVNPNNPKLQQQDNILVDKLQVLNYLSLAMRNIINQKKFSFMISIQGKNIQKEEWYDYDGGYYLALVLTYRELQAHFKKQGFP